jgi:hypothetical protein
MSRPCLFSRQRFQIRLRVAARHHRGRIFGRPRVGAYRTFSGTKSHCAAAWNRAEKIDDLSSRSGPVRHNPLQPSNKYLILLASRAGVNNPEQPRRKPPFVRLMLSFDAVKAESRPSAVASPDMTALRNGYIAIAVSQPPMSAVGPKRTGCLPKKSSTDAEADKRTYCETVSRSRLTSFVRERLPVGGEAFACRRSFLNVSGAGRRASLSRAR